MLFLILFTVIVHQPNIERPKQPPEKPSKLGPENTAFPDLKPPAPIDRTKKDDSQRYAKERFDLVFKDMLPELPKDATTLQKVQYEQARSGFLYLQQILEVIDLGRWDSAYYKEYLYMSSEAHRPAAELHPTTEGRIRCYEARIIMLKEAENFVQIRVNTGNQPPQDAHSARFSRLQAEADLLKLKESLKDKK